MPNVIVTMTIKEGRMADFLAACADLQPKVLAERGCLEYAYFRDAALPPSHAPADPNRLTLLERWESPAALQAHLQTAHMKAFGERVEGLRAGVEVRVVEPAF